MQKRSVFFNNCKSRDSWPSALLHDWYRSSAGKVAPCVCKPNWSAVKRRRNPALSLMRKLGWSNSETTSFQFKFGAISTTTYNKKKKKNNKILQDASAVAANFLTWTNISIFQEVGGPSSLLSPIVSCSGHACDVPFRKCLRECSSNPVWVRVM